MTTFHAPVMTDEVLTVFESVSHINNLTGKSLESHIFVDATLGTGGHTLALARKGAKVIGIENDPEMLAIAESRLVEEGLSKSVTLIGDNFINIDRIATNLAIKVVDGVLFDLGVNTLQLTSKQRGFSFANPRALLDMRIRKIGPTAAELLNILNKNQLTEVFEKVVGGKKAHWIASRIVQRRSLKPFRTISDFTQILAGFEKKGLNKATLPMLALRIAVNSEDLNIVEALPKAFDLVRQGGAMAVISFHSFEDELVVNTFAEIQNKFPESIQVGPIYPSKMEVKKNISARSAILRILKK